MIKKLISLAVASVSTLALAGCGATDPIVQDTSLMGDGTSNKTGLGGYWWTYVDRSGKSSVTPDTGKSNPMDTTTRPATSILKSSIGPGVGIEEGAFHVTGTVGVAPKYNDTSPEVYDTYWDAFYGPGSSDAGGVCGEGGCKEMKYPAVGLGFGFKAKNVPLGNDAAGKIGVAFKMKLGAGHPDASPINISFPMDVTDVPDPTFEDQFGSKFSNIDAPGSAPATANAPLCTFPNTIKDDGTPVGSTNKTCFANVTTDGHTPFVADLNKTTFTTICLKWSALGSPGWASSALAAPTNPVPVSGVIPERIIKMQFDAFKPAETATAAVPFDFWVDDVYLLDQAKWDTICGPASGAKVYEGV